MRETHTYARLEVSARTFEEIRSALEAAGYQHAFLEDGVIDMHGIGIAEAPPTWNGLYVDDETGRVHRFGAAGRASPSPHPWRFAERHPFGFWIFKVDGAFLSDEQAPHVMLSLRPIRATYRGQPVVHVNPEDLPGNR